MNNDFQKKLLDYSTGGVVSLAVALGNKLGLFTALDEVSSATKPATPQQVAEKARCNPRYVKEWLSCLACAEIIEIDEKERFWIAACKRRDLITEPFGPFVRMGYLPTFANIFDMLVEAMKDEDARLGIDYSKFSEYYRIRDEYTKASHGKFLINRILPDIGHDLVQRLNTQSLRCLDVGCGSGFHAILMAQEFTSSSFTGLDIAECALKTAREECEKAKLTNLTFVNLDARELPSEWGASFDFVTIFDACHDQTRPDLCLAEIHRILRPGGIFAMIEIDGTSSVVKDKEVGSLRAALSYGSSLFHCLPVGSNSPDALCLGSMWGRQRATALLAGAGFTIIEIKSLPYISNCMYICRK